MRRQDELLTIYPTRDPYTRKFILSQVEGLALAFDSEELLEFLQRERGDNSPLIRQQALFTLARFLPGFIRKRYFLADPLPGLWSGYARPPASAFATPDRDPEAPAPGGPDRPEGEPASPADRSQRLAGLFLLTPLAASLLNLAEGRGPFSSEALLALTRYPLRSINRRLRNDLLPGSGFEWQLASAFTSASDEFQAEIISLIRQHGARNQGLLLLLAQLSPDKGFPLLMDLVPRTDVTGRINLALALARLGDVDHEAAVRRLAKWGEGWVAVYCLRALEATGSAQSFSTIVAIHDTVPNPFIRNQAVRACGAIPCVESLDFCLAALRSPQEEIQAQALESLVRLRCPADVLRRSATALLKSPSVRARVNAILATAQHDDDQMAEGLADLLFSDDTMDRLEAAYCLGYLQSKRSLSYLQTFCQFDPSLAVRLQAIKSLSKYPARYSVSSLITLVGAGEARIALTASRVLTRYEHREAELVSDQVMRAISRSGRPVEKALLFRTLGAAAGKTGHRPALALLHDGLEDKEAVVQRGAIEGWLLLGGEGTEEADRRLTMLCASGDARIEARALLALLVHGRTHAVEPLARMLASDDPLRVGPAVETALEAGLLLETGELAGRFPSLGARLSEIVGSPDYERFADSDEITLKDWARMARQPAGREVGQEGEFDVRRAHLHARASRAEASPRQESDLAAVDALSKSAIDGVAIGSKAQSLENQSLRDIQPGSEPAARLQKHLEDPRLVDRSGPDRLARRLREATYQVSDKLPEPGPGWRMPSVQSLVVLFGIIVALAILDITHSRLRSLANPVRSTLVAHSVAGDVVQSGQGSDRPLLNKQKIEPDTEITLGARSSVRLLSNWGSVILVGPSAKLKVERLSDSPPHLVLTIARGPFGFELKQDEEAEIRHGRFTLKAHRAIFTIEEQENRPTLAVQSGRVAVEEKEGSTTTLLSKDVKVLGP